MMVNNFIIRSIDEKLTGWKTRWLIQMIFFQCGSASPCRTVACHSPAVVLSSLLSLEEQMAVSGSQKKEEEQQQQQQRRTSSSLFIIILLCRCYVCSCRPRQCGRYRSILPWQLRAVQEKGVRNKILPFKILKRNRFSWGKSNTFCEKI